LLVGRERELGMLRDHLTAALMGRGNLILIGGEAGIGKTALTETLCLEASERGALVLTGRAFDLAETPPFGPWIDLFSHYKPAADQAPPPAPFAERGTVGAVASQALLFHSVLDFLAAVSAQHPLVILLEDTHWQDGASLDLLRFLAREIAPLPVLLLVTYRVDELTRRHALYQLLPTLERESRAVRLDLQRLSPDAVRTLVVTRYALVQSDVDRLAAWLEERAGGNAFFTLQLLRALEEQGVLRDDRDSWALGDLAAVRLPLAVRQIIDIRILRLDRESQRLLAVAAVIGQDVPFDVWAVVAAADETTLFATVEQADEARLVEAHADGTGMRFVHALIREALYEGILPPRRRVLHRQVGEVLFVLANPDPDAVAFHFQRAGDARAAEWLVRAGERAQDAYAWLTAAVRYEAALALMPESRERGWLLYRLSRVRRWESPERSSACLDEALRVANRHDDPALAALVRYTRGVVRYVGMFDYARGVADMTAGAAAVEALSEWERERLHPYEPVLASYPRLGLGQLYLFIGRYRDLAAIDEAYRETRRAMAISEEPATAVLINRRTVSAVGYAMLGRSAERAEDWAAEEAQYRATEDDQRLGQALLWKLYVALQYATDDRALRRQLAAESEEAFRRASRIRGGDPRRDARIPVLVLEGEWDAACMLLGHSRDSGLLSNILAWSGVIPLARGETAQVVRLIDAALPGGPVTAPGERPYVPSQNGQRLAIALYLDAGDLPQARAWLEAYDRWLAWSGAEWGQSEGQTLWARYHRLSNDTARAVAHAERALTHATEPRQPLALLGAHRLLGELHTEAVRYEDAAEHLQASLTLADACAAPYERALTLLARAELDTATGDTVAARTVLDEARTVLERLGARPALARADAIVAHLTVPTPSRPPSYPSGLTLREVDVLRLVTTGLSNAEIAERLFLSERTVEKHLQGIYNKLGSSSRAAAAAFAVQHHLV
jgi:DNA-binding CsgD family transcriptional regulator